MESKSKKIDIVMATYNGEKYISEQLDSIVNSEDFNNYIKNIIIVDDGSTDDSYKIAKSFEGIGVPLRVFTKKNGGKGAALNLGISKATGQLIATKSVHRFQTARTPECVCHPIWRVAAANARRGAKPFN